MYCFSVNGQDIDCPDNINILQLLRDRLHITSVKNGCAQGACGACMILLDGEAKRACTLTAAKADGKQILTVEGLSRREKEVFAYAFAAAGAVQCGFCTPGMVISAKGLLDQYPDPDLEQIKQALRYNVCRCTGYIKIEQAILLAAQLLREKAPLPSLQTTGIVPRLDAAAKALGIAEYSDDIYLPKMLYGSAVRSAYPRARIISIDTAEARAVEGVVAVLTAENIPGERVIGHIKRDYDVLLPVGGISRFLGDAVVLIAAENKQALEQAKELVKIEYQPLEGVFSPQQAMAENAPLVHEENQNGNLLVQEKLRRGDAAEKIAAAAYSVTNTYHLPPTEHAFLEPETAVALPEGEGVLIYCGDQGIYQTRRECAEMLGLPEDKVRVIARMVGGGFGGKEDMSVQHHAALLAWHCRRPVKVSLSRDESILIHPKRHAMDIEVTTACDREGKLTAFRARLIADAGAYASLSGPVLQRACTHAAGPYNYQDIDIEGYAYYTNNPPGGAFRGFGVTQSCFACECNLNQLAEKVGISPFEIRLKNAVRPGDVLPNGQIATADTAFVETLLAVRDFYYQHPGCGIASAMKNSGIGVGLEDIGRCRLQVSGGKVHVYSSAACIGQGLATILCQIISAAAEISPELLSYEQPDTQLAPDSGNTTASRQTMFTGEAARRAAIQLAQALTKAGSIDALEGQEFFGEYSGITDKYGTVDCVNPVSHIAYGYATQVVVLDQQGKVARIMAAHDVGHAINRLNVEGQIEGGAAMSLGYALTEDFPVEQGRPLVKFANLGLFHAADMPIIETIIVDNPRIGPLAGGAKGVGEIAAIPAAPAVQNAYYLRDGLFRTTLPLADTAYTKRKR